MASSWTSRIKAAKIILVVVLVMHVGTYYLKPLLISDKNKLQGDTGEHKKQTKCD
jgi:hypothetical protein